MELSRALGLQQKETVALIGGGGKTTVMYRLCREAAAAGRHAIASGTARFTPPADRLDAPILVNEDEAALLGEARLRLRDAPWLILACGHGSKGRLLPIHDPTVESLASDPALDLLALEADGSGLRPFKAPAEHEPVIPRRATLVVAVVGADVFGRPLTEEVVHRADRVAALTGARSGDPVTPAIVAAVLCHPEGGRKGLPDGARFAVVVNKVSEARRAQAEEAAKLLLEHGAGRVVLAQARERDAVVAVYGAGA